MKKYFFVLSAVILAAAVSGCNPYNEAGEGAATGGAVGALAGGIIGHQSHDTAAGMLIGGALGAVTGAAVGSQMQKPVPPPQEVVVTQPAGVPTSTYSGDAVTINVPNDSGGYTAVVLKRSGNGYVGPQGEYYTQVPSTEQLKVMYGR
jgi:hypothetical protein